MAARRGALTVFALVVLVAACGEKSRVDPNAAITVSGVVHAADGGPLAGRPVQLGAGITDSDVGLAILTLGLSCTSGNCTGSRFDTTTDSSGAYALHLTGRDTQSTFGEAVRELVTTSAAPAGAQISGASVAAQFKIQTATVQMPDLALVDPSLAVAGAQDVTATWSTPRPGPYTLTFETANPAAVWQTVTASSPASVDPRLLEDTSGRVVVSGQSSDSVQGSGVTITWRSPGVGYVSGAGAPPSRGRPCRYVDPSGATVAEVAACGLTDGQLAVPAVTAAPAATAVVVELATAVPAELVVVRGCTGGCEVDVSSDGSTFTSAGSVSDDFGSVSLDGSPVNAVRVSLGTHPTLREVSVWGPRPARPALLAPKASDPGKLRHSFGTGGSSAEDRPVGLIVGAVALAIAVLLGAGFAMGRRRPTT